MKICPYCRSPNHDGYQMCVRCRRLSPGEEQRRRFSTMLLPKKETMEFVPAGTAQGEQKKTGATISVPNNVPAVAAQPAQKPGAPLAPKPMMQALPVRPAGALPPIPAELPSDFTACNALAMQYYNAGVYDRAEAVFKRCTELNPNDVTAWMLRGVSLRCLRKVDEALSCFDRAIQLRPDNIDAWRRKGFTLRILNRTEDAIKCYEKIVELNPKDTAALNDKASALDDLKRHEEAIKVYELVLRISPKDRYALDNKEATERILKRKAADDYRSQFFGPKPI
jgi:tetratricopeptide (TPR) repeat protein